MKTIVLRAVGALFLIVVLHWARTRGSAGRPEPAEEAKRVSLYEQAEVKQSKARFEASLKAYYLTLRQEAADLEIRLMQRQLDRRAAMARAAKGHPELERAVAAGRGFQPLTRYDDAGVTEPTWTDVRRIERHLAQLRAQ